MKKSGTLKKQLGIVAIVGLGLGYMSTTVIFDTFGIVSKITNGLVPLAYIVGLTVMIFTAISYGKMVRVYPDAGSAYSYTRHTLGENMGFFVGWASLLDYLLLPMVNALIVRIYMESLFPDIAPWIWVVAYVIFATVINSISMRSTSSVNLLMLLFSGTLVIAFIVLAYLQLSKGVGQGTILTIRPLWYENMDKIAVLTGATVVAFSFIGFDAITMYSEEAKDQNTVPRAIIITVMLGGLIFFVSAYFAQALFPDLSVFNNTDDTLPEIGYLVGGKIFYFLFLSGAFAACIASGLASHASVSRLLYVMGRGGALPQMFGYVSPKYHTPIVATVVTGIVSLGAIGPDLEIIASVINFGALIAFSFVNLAVISHFIYHEKQYHTFKDIFRYFIMPMIGFLLTMILWAHLHLDAFIGGFIWLAIGFCQFLYLTRFFRRSIAQYRLDLD